MMSVRNTSGPISANPGCGLIYEFAAHMNGRCEVTIAARVDLSLARSSATFPISDMVEAVRWGHFERGDVPWEAGQRI